MLEPRLVFPILLIYDGVSVLAERAAFERMLSLVTEKAIRDGFLRDARIVDADRRVVRIQRLVREDPRLFGWLKPRTIRELELRSVQENVDVALVRSWVVDALEGLRDILSSNHDVDVVLARVRTAGDLEAIRAAVREIS